MQDTYPICIGHKNACHDIVEQKFVNELNNLASGINNVFYSKQLSRYIHLHFKIIASLGDQPERREINCLLNGNSTFGGRYLYSANINEIKKNLVPCNSCYEGMKYDSLFLSRKILCKDCLRWDMMTDNNLSKFDPPNHYPKEMLTQNSQLKPFKISFEILQETVVVCTNKYVSGEWNEATTRCYANTRGISSHGVDKLLEHATNISAYRFFNDSDERESPLSKQIILDCRKHPQKYEMWKGGPFWN